MDSTGWFFSDFDDPKTRSELNDDGKEGFELVRTALARPDGTNQGLVATFKRPRA
jgi:Domain of unknown function (DUF4177)